MILIAEKKGCDCQDLVHYQIKVPPLRVTKADIEALVNYYIALYCRQRGIPKPRITPEALRRLQSYDFPGNLRELASLVERALVQADGAELLTEGVFWPERSRQRRFRWNLLNAYPQLRAFLRSPWWPDRLNYDLTALSPDCRYWSSGAARSPTQLYPEPLLGVVVAGLIANFSLFGAHLVCGLPLYDLRRSPAKAVPEDLASEAAALAASTS